MIGKKLDRDKLLTLVKKIINDDFCTEKEADDAIYKFNQNCINPEGSNLIYHHKPKLTPEEIVDKALSYKPIIMPPPSKD